MNKAYDILLNFETKYPIPFYEWNDNDRLSHIKKIGILKVDNKTYNDLFNYEIKLDISSIDSEIRECLTYNGTKYEERILIIAGDAGVFGIKYKSNGEIIGRSRLLMDEEKEINELSDLMGIIKIKYKRGNKLDYDDRLTRLENELKRKYEKELIKTKNIDKLRFWYYEIYGKEATSENIVDELKQVKDINIIKNLIHN